MLPVHPHSGGVILPVYRKKSQLDLTSQNELCNTNGCSSALCPV